MNKRPAKRSARTSTSNDRGTVGKGGETHQPRGPKDPALTTNHGTQISDNQNSLRAGVRGPTLLEDFVLREKITHFDHERIPERIVHARGSAAHGYFQPTRSFSGLTRAAFLQDPQKKTPVFVRFSTVAGGAGSPDLARDVRGFAIKFYTEEGNFDLVGNNIPVFFIQDAMKFPDLVHAVKPEPDRGFPQAASAHDTFWDFVSLTPESMHMLCWVMSDRAIPRSLRMIEGFGVHTFRLVNARGESKFVKWHLRPALGAQSVVWDEAVKLNGADMDYHRRDLWNSIDQGDFPEWTLSVQVLDEKQAASLDFDVLDPTKVIPEEQFPLQPLGRLVLDRNPDNFFAENEQVAFLPSNIVPGIDFSEDPLLQGRLFSYQDTQLIRLGGPNFHQIPINRPKCPFANHQRDGKMQMDVPKGRVAYEPSSLEASSPREDAKRGFRSVPVATTGAKVRERSETFSDHYSQARMFYRSMTEPEQKHIAAAFAFELGKVETVAVRTRMLGHLQLIDPALGDQVERLLGMEGQADDITPMRAPMDLRPSPALSILGKFQPTLVGRKVGALVTDEVDRATLDALRSRVEKAGAALAVVAPKIGGVTASDGRRVAADHALAAGPSVLFDAVVVMASEEGAEMLCANPAALQWVKDAHTHCKVIGTAPTSQALLDAAGIQADEGVITLGGPKDVARFVSLAEKGRVWAREA